MLIQYVKGKADNISCRSDKINVGSPANMIALSDFLVGSSDKISYPTYTSESRLYMSGLPTLHLRIFRKNMSGITELRKLRFRFLNLNLSESPTYMTAMSLYTSVVGIAEEKNRKFRQPKYFAEPPTYMSDFPKNTSVVGRSILHFLQCNSMTPLLTNER